LDRQGDGGWQVTSAENQQNGHQGGTKNRLPKQVEKLLQGRRCGAEHQVAGGEVDQGNHHENNQPQGQPLFAKGKQTQGKPHIAGIGEYHCQTEGLEVEPQHPEYQPAQGGKSGHHQQRELGQHQEIPPLQSSLIDGGHDQAGGGDIGHQTVDEFG